jgi:release factor glutamine methyltransferase
MIFLPELRMQIKTWLTESTKKLKQADIGTARLNALVLLEDATGKDRAWLLANPDFEIPAKQQAVLKNLLKRRALHEPLAYIRGRTEFYGHEFVLTPAVLEPRPESETMIDLLKKLPNPPTRARIADVGTGSGALGITAKLELKNVDVDLLELDPAALTVAKMNVDKYTLGLRAIESNLLAASKQSYDVLLCNLPYVPDDYHINEAAGQEPRTAIFGGSDGLDVYRKLFQQLKIRSQRPLYILTESLPPQHTALQAVAEQCGYNLLIEDDFIQVFRLH